MWTFWYLLVSEMSHLRFLRICPQPSAQLRSRQEIDNTSEGDKLFRNKLIPSSLRDKALLCGMFGTTTWRPGVHYCLCFKVWAICILQQSCFLYIFNTWERRSIHNIHRMKIKHHRCRRAHNMQNLRMSSNHKIPSLSQLIWLSR